MAFKTILANLYWPNNGTLGIWGWWARIRMINFSLPMMKRSANEVYNGTGKTKTKVQMNVIENRMGNQEWTIQWSRQSWAHKTQDEGKQHTHTQWSRQSWAHKTQDEGKQQTHTQWSRQSWVHKTQDEGKQHTHIQHRKLRL